MNVGIRTSRYRPPSLSLPVLSRLPVLTPGSAVDIPLRLGADQWYDPAYHAAFLFSQTDGLVPDYDPEPNEGPFIIGIRNRARSRGNSTNLTLSSAPFIPIEFGFGVLPRIFSFRGTRVVRFPEGASFNSSSGDANSSDSFLSSAITSCTLFVVAEQLAVQLLAGIVGLTSGASFTASRFLGCNSSASPPVIASRAGAVGQFNVTYSPPANATDGRLPPSIITLTQSAVSVNSIYINGALGRSTGGVTSATLPTSSIRVFSIGRGSPANGSSSSSYFDGWIGDVIRFPRELSHRERQAVERYLSDKYSIPVQGT
jgi:hypothetical protein